MPARRDAIRSHAAGHAQRSEHGREAARLLARQGSPVAKRCARNVTETMTNTIPGPEAVVTAVPAPVPAETENGVQ